MAALVAYYSRAGENYFKGERRYLEVGNTEKAAGFIAEATGADVFKIEQKIPYSSDYDTCVKEAVADFRAKARPELLSKPETIEGYDEIYLGFPNYCGDMPMAVYTFLESFDWSGKVIYPFCTHEGSGMGKSESRIAETCPGAEVREGLVVKGCEVDEKADEIKAWAIKVSAGKKSSENQVDM